MSLNKGAKLGNFYHDTGEGGCSKYHLKAGGDLVWENWKWLLWLQK